MRRISLIVALATVVLASTARVVAAGNIQLAWDANTELDIAGYIVEYGTVAAPFTTRVDVGNVTTWTFAAPTSGLVYGFRVYAYDTSGLTSDPSAAVYGSDTGIAPPNVSVNRSSLVFSSVTGSTTVTAAQTIYLTESSGGAVPWSVSTTATWLQVSPAGGTGSGAFTVSLVPGSVPSSNASATLTFSVPGAMDLLNPVNVSLNVIAPSATQPPFGSFDTPTDNTSGVTGSLAITGWALDDVGVSQVRILRDPVLGETPGQLVLIGTATLVEDARPDVTNAYATYPDSYRAGWGYLALTNMLPNGGSGTFRLYAYADDLDGHSTLLGTKTITCANPGTPPFGAIDSPAPGQTVSGTVTNFGWVLSHGTTTFADGAQGGTVSVLIDGVNVGSPMGWTSRPDLLPLFPVVQYGGINFAEAVFAFDSTKLTDGVHTIAWVVTDTKGTTSGIGSRFFRVFNGAGATASLVAAAHAGPAMRAAAVSAAPQIDLTPIQARHGFDLSAPFQTYTPDSTGLMTVQAEEVDRIEVKTDGATSGYLQVGTGQKPLPMGSNLDPATGDFVWLPPAGFVGPYDLTFVHSAGGATVQENVRIVLNPRSSNLVGPQLVVDSTQPFVGGWAADLDSQSGTGISAIHVWAYPVEASGALGSPVFVGVAAYGGDRPDVAAAFGSQFRFSGFGISIDALPPGTYDIALFPFSVARNGFLPATVVQVVVK
jgi:hypothetical protein